MSSQQRFLLDENVPREVNEFLEKKGFLAEYPPRGLSNSELATLAKERKAVLVSRDTDFLKSDVFRPEEFSGIIVFRIHPPNPEDLVKGISLCLEKIKEFKGKLIVIGKYWLKLVEAK
jgi:predicted nuclease of predicted toxin-antitoxin system